MKPAASWLPAEGSLQSLVCERAKSMKAGSPSWFPPLPPSHLDSLLHCLITPISKLSNLLDGFPHLSWSDSPKTLLSNHSCSQNPSIPFKLTQSKIQTRSTRPHLSCPLAPPQHSELVSYHPLPCLRLSKPHCPPCCLSNPPRCCL